MDLGCFHKYIAFYAYINCCKTNSSLYGAIKSEFERGLNMNKEWSELNKTMQAQIKKKDTYKRGIDTLLTLRSQLIQTLVSFKEELCREDFNSIPFINADGYHSKTIAYSIWHIFRIEDIVVHTVINEDEQVFFCRQLSRAYQFTYHYNRK